VDIVTLGEAMAVMVPASPGPLRHVRTFDKHVAGAEFNLAIGVARLGLTSGWISRIGQDGFGAEILGVLRSEGVDVRHVNASPRPTGLYFKEYLPGREPHVYYYRTGSAAADLGPADIDPDYIRGARVLHVTGITPLLSQSSAQAVQKAMEVARSSGVTISLDPNIRFKLIDRQAVPGVFLPLVQASDIILAGESEIQAILGTASSGEALEQQILGIGPRLVVTKRGSSGASARSLSERAEEVAFPVQHVVDPIGAGDGFDAGFLAAWLRGWSLRDSLRLANLVGACATGVHGDYEGYPTWGEALTILGGDAPDNR
jgi:2-dehydro-3-deoxygluconokinase